MLFSWKVVREEEYSKWNGSFNPLDQTNTEKEGQSSQIFGGDKLTTLSKLASATSPNN